MKQCKLQRVYSPPATSISSAPINLSTPIMKHHSKEHSATKTESHNSTSCTAPRLSPITDNLREEIRKSGASDPKSIKGLDQLEREQLYQQSNKNIRSKSSSQSINRTSHLAVRPNSLKFTEQSQHCKAINYVMQASSMNQSQPASMKNSCGQSRCYLCDTPKNDYSLIRSFSEIVCRGCVNFEGPDQVESEIIRARMIKLSSQSVSDCAECQRAPQAPFTSSLLTPVSGCGPSSGSSSPMVAGLPGGPAHLNNNIQQQLSTRPANKQCLAADNSNHQQSSANLSLLTPNNQNNKNTSLKSIQTILSNRLEHNRSHKNPPQETPQNLSNLETNRGISPIDPIKHLDGLLSNPTGNNLAHDRAISGETVNRLEQKSAQFSCEQNARTAINPSIKVIDYDTITNDNHSATKINDNDACDSLRNASYIRKKQAFTQETQQPSISARRLNGDEVTNLNNRNDQVANDKKICNSYDNNISDSIINIDGHKQKSGKDAQDSTGSDYHDTTSLHSSRTVDKHTLDNQSKRVEQISEAAYRCRHDSANDTIKTNVGGRDPEGPGSSQSSANQVDKNQLTINTRINAKVTPNTNSDAEKMSIARLYTNSNHHQLTKQQLTTSHINQQQTQKQPTPTNNDALNNLHQSFEHSQTNYQLLEPRLMALRNQFELQTSEHANVNLNSLNQLTNHLMQGMNVADCQIADASQPGSTSNHSPTYLSQGRLIARPAPSGPHHPIPAYANVPSQWLRRIESPTSVLSMALGRHPVETANYDAYLNARLSDIQNNLAISLMTGQQHNRPNQFQNHNLSLLANGHTHSSTSSSSLLNELTNAPGASKPSANKKTSSSPNANCMGGNAVAGRFSMVDWPHQAVHWTDHPPDKPYSDTIYADPGISQSVLFGAPACQTIPAHLANQTHRLLSLPKAYPPNMNQGDSIQGSAVNQQFREQVMCSPLSMAHYATQHRTTLEAASSTNHQNNKTGSKEQSNDLDSKRAKTRTNDIIEDETECDNSSIQVDIDDTLNLLNESEEMLTSRINEPQNTAKSNNKVPTEDDARGSSKKQTDVTTSVSQRTDQQNSNSNPSDVNEIDVQCEILNNESLTINPRNSESPEIMNHMVPHTRLNDVDVTANTTSSTSPRENPTSAPSSSRQNQILHKKQCFTIDTLITRSSLLPESGKTSHILQSNAFVPTNGSTNSSQPPNNRTTNKRNSEPSGTSTSPRITNTSSQQRQLMVANKRLKRTPRDSALLATGANRKSIAYDAKDSPERIEPIGLKRQQLQNQQSKQQEHLSQMVQCYICSNLIGDQDFVQCPSNTLHKFCFPCSKSSIQKQQADCRKDSRSSEHKIFCPSGKKCLLQNDNISWTFMTNEIETIFRAHSKSSTGRDTTTPGRRCDQTTRERLEQTIGPSKDVENTVSKGGDQLNPATGKGKSAQISTITTGIEQSDRSDVNKNKQTSSKPGQMMPEVASRSISSELNTKTIRNQLGPAHNGVGSGVDARQTPIDQHENKTK